jgi:hypothetical protein
MLAEPPSPNDIADLADPVIELAKTGHVHQAEIIIAYLALWLLRRVETGRMSREDADRVFTVLDVQFTDDGLGDALSDEAHDLIAEGHHFHHWGEEWGTNPIRVRALADAIIARPT